MLARLCRMEPQLHLAPFSPSERRARMPVADMKGGGNANIGTEISA
jgi:hypothetical protein